MKILSVVGARPNFIKIAPFIAAINKFNQSTNQPIEHVLVHTGQHYDTEMSEVFFKELEIPPPDINLEVGSGSHSWQTAEIMKSFEPVLYKEQPDAVVVVGDVNSTLACSLVASKIEYGRSTQNSKLITHNSGVSRPLIAHIEAGLRSYDRTMPEEINRIITDSLSDILFTPSSDANENLKKEGISENRIKLVGNIMIDTLVSNLERARQKNILDRLGLKARNFVYVTLHRPSNVDQREVIEIIMGELGQLSKEMPVIFPVHPRTRKMLCEFGIRVENNSHLLILDPIGYHDSICLIEHARFVMTDSGGIQEETTFFRTPCLTLRPNTERPITITEGSNKLTNHANLNNDIRKLLEKPDRIGNIPLFWDGKTGERIVHFLNENYEGREETPIQ
jgi:UDP-N-acetylglucosamine 2-epimerase (non-hydrolysing)